MNNRDWEYVETRLMAPAIGAHEAHERLKQVGALDEAAALMEAMKEFNDKCRDIRYQLTQHRK